MKNKIIVIGPSSKHVSNFIGLIKNLFREIVYIGEEDLDCESITKHHKINFRSKNPFSIFTNYRKLKKIIAAENADIVHIHQVNRVAFMASKCLSALNKKYVVTAWGSDVLVIPNKNKMFRKMTQRVLKHAAYITADSKNMLDAISKLTQNANKRLVLLGIEPVKKAQKEKLIFSNRALYQLYNIEGVVKEFYDFQKNNSEWTLVIASVGDELMALQNKVNELKINDKVIFVGWLDNQKNEEYYSRATIYISLPFSDGTSVSLLEAMSAGCIPVLSNLPVSQEWIESGKNGIIKSINKNALEEALSLNITEVAQINEKIINTRASHLISTENFNSIYQQILND